MRRQRRFINEAEIIAAIDKLQKKIPAMVAKAEAVIEEIEFLKHQEVDGNGDPLTDEGREWNRERIAELRKEEKRLRRKAFLVETSKLPKLGERLAEIRTPQLAALDNGDCSIPR